MPSWSELQHDLLVEIVRRINLIEDYLNFGTVCKSWRSVATKDNFNSELPRVPWLMLAEEEDDSDSCCRKFVSIYNGMILKKRIPKASRKRCLESMGWLITVGEMSMSDFEMSLLHPFSGVQIKLPLRIAFSTGDVVHKAVLSANPSHTSDYVLMTIDRNSKFLSFWRPGDLVWTNFGDLYSYSNFRDVVYYNGQFYALDNAGNILVCDVDSPETTERLILACVEDSEGHTRATRWRPPSGAKLYLLESLGSLFVVMQCGAALRKAKGDGNRIPLTCDGYHYVYGDDGDDDVYATYGTTHFLVFQADLAAGRLRETRNLGDTAFFLGASTSLSVQASQAQSYLFYRLLLGYIHQV